MEDNFIKGYNGVLDRNTCNLIINIFEESRALGVGVTRNDTYKKDEQVAIDPVSRHLNVSETAISESVYKSLTASINDYMSHYSLDEILKGKVWARDVLIQRTDADKFESFHKWHCEAACTNTSGRAMAWMIYLNDDFEGGGTEFKFQKHIEQPETGKLLLWPANFTHVHRGGMLLSGSKYILTGWLYY
jgi:hypothetical protein